MSIRSNVDARGLDQRIRFQRRTETQGEVSGSEGDIVVTWPTVADCWARVDGDKASEHHHDDAIRTPGGYTIWVRADVVKRYCITPLDRILWGCNVLDIKAMPDQQLRGRMAALICQANVTPG